MPSLSTTIEDTSPVIIYSGSGGADWSPGRSSSDPFAELYSQSSFMLTQKNGSSLSFSFSGTGVQIFGAKRSNHGLFQISIDSTTYPPVNGSGGDQPNDFQISLFNGVVPNNGLHQVTMTSLGTTFLDVDFITWQTPIGLSDEQLLAITAQDSEYSFKYTPESAWNVIPTNVGMFSGGSGHATTTAGACAEFTFSFTGSAVALFGSVGPTCAPYSVQLDSQSPTNFSANKQFYRPQQMLFQAGNLESGKHTVRIVSEAWDSSALQLAIDYAQVFTTPSLQASDRAAGSRLSVGSIIGISIGIIAFLVAIVAILTIFLPSKYWKFLRLKGTIKEKFVFVPEAFDYQQISGSANSHSQPVTHGHSRQTSSPQGTPTTALMSSSSMGTFGMYSSTPESPAGPNTQIITVPFTPDGKYRPDLQSTLQLSPPPGNRDNQPLLEQSLRHLRQTRSQPQLPAGAAQPVVGRIGEDSTISNRAVLIPLRWPSGANVTAASRANVHGMEMTEPPLYQWK